MSEEIYIDRNGLPYQLVRTKVVDLTSAESKPYWGRLKDGYELVITRQGMIGIAKRLSELKVTAVFALVGEHLEIGNRNSKTLHREYETVWKTGLDEVELYFVSSGVNQYLVLRDTSDGRVFLPPLPNIYPEGRACMPDGLALDSETQAELLETSLKALQRSNWNTDLVKDQPARWDLDFNPIPLDQYQDQSERRYLPWI